MTHNVAGRVTYTEMMMYISGLWLNNALLLVCYRLPD